MPYVVVRILGLVLQLRLNAEGPDADPRGARTWAGLSSIGLVLVLAGAFADPSLRVALWTLTIVADIVAAEIAGRAQEWDLHAGHLSERHGLFVIIALGESLIVAGTAVAAEERTAALTGVAILAVVVACLLWWTYFGWLKEALEHGASRANRSQMGPLARDAFSLSHSRWCAASLAMRWPSRRWSPIRPIRRALPWSVRWAWGWRCSSASPRSRTGGCRAECCSAACSSSVVWGPRSSR